MLKKVIKTAILFIMLLTSATASYAEELLKIKDIEYLGWRVSNEEFLPCGAKKTIKIDDGAKVTKTSRRCNSSPIFTVTEGTIANVDTKENTVAVDKGKARESYYYPFASDLSDKVGKKVTIQSASEKGGPKGLEERAISIKVE